MAYRTSNSGPWGGTKEAVWIEQQERIDYGMAALSYDGEGGGDNRTSNPTSSNPAQNSFFLVFWGAFWAGFQAGLGLGSFLHVLQSS
jgi:hypothetical protein